MILKNGKIYSEGKIFIGSILINDGLIKSILINPSIDEMKLLAENNKDGKENDCNGCFIIPGIIDIHSHLRDMGQSEKETFLTGTQSAAYSGITTVIDMPNTKPPAISAEQIKIWMEKAEKNIYIDVGFIAGVPYGINEDEIKKIINLGVIGFKIYPASPLSEIDWMKRSNIQNLIKISSNNQIPIFIHPEWPKNQEEKEILIKDYQLNNYSFLEVHDLMHSVETELNYTKLFIKNYDEFIKRNNLEKKDYPIVHFCHISCKESYKVIKNVLEENNAYKITYEITPHHLLLSNTSLVDNPSHSKVLPPLRDIAHSKYLFDELIHGNIDIIATDHAPHTKEEKNQDPLKSPSGFPGFETYPLLLLDKVLNNELSLNFFVKAASINPARLLNLVNKGRIKEGFIADLLLFKRVQEYAIDVKNFKTKSKLSPYEGQKTLVHIWKVFLRGEEINLEETAPRGKIIIR